MRIFLIGFMGSGKTHWGTRIAEKLQIPFYDLDAVIVNAEGMSISEIFAIKGEEYFRYMEKQTLEDLVSREEHFVLSAGGGTPCFFNNIEFMKKNGKVLWLNTSLEVLNQRLLKEKKTRPLLRNINEAGLRAYIIRKLSERKMYYEQADLMVHEETMELELLIGLLQ
ncbi:MAG TPA: shikimate kinase [Chitinophagaceae bacterium]|nr:shikimate kinase [Chitinophagaceae bacterium]